MDFKPFVEDGLNYIIPMLIFQHKYTKNTLNTLPGKIDIYTKKSYNNIEYVSWGNLFSFYPIQFSLIMKVGFIYEEIRIYACGHFAC